MQEQTTFSRAEVVEVYCKSERLGCSVPPSQGSESVNFANNQAVFGLLGSILSMSAHDGRKK